MNKYLRFLYWLESFVRKKETEARAIDIDKYVEIAKLAQYVEVEKDEKSSKRI